MRTYAMFNFDYLFNDHFAKVSADAKLLYVNMMFYAAEGFVANPVIILDSLGYDKSILQELINNGEILTLNGRDEVFITSYYIHNHNFNYMGWTRTPFGQYWKGKLFIKRNRIATMRKLKEEEQAPENPKENVAPPVIEDAIENQKLVTEEEQETESESEKSFEDLIDEICDDEPAEQPVTDNIAAIQELDKILKEKYGA